MQLKTHCMRRFSHSILLTPFYAGFAPSGLFPFKQRASSTFSFERKLPLLSNSRSVGGRTPLSVPSMSSVREPKAVIMSERVRKFLERVPGSPIKGFEAADR